MHVRMWWCFGEEGKGRVFVPEGRRRGRIKERREGKWRKRKEGCEGISRGSQAM